MFDIPFKVEDQLHLDASVSETPHRGSFVEVISLPPVPPRDAGVRCVLVECYHSGDGVLLVGERAMVAPNRLMTKEDWATRCQETEKKAQERDRRKACSLHLSGLLRHLLPKSVGVSISREGSLCIVLGNPLEEVREVARVLEEVPLDEDICGFFEIPTEGGGDSDRYLCTLTKGHGGKHWDPMWGTSGSTQT